MRSTFCVAMLGLLGVALPASAQSSSATQRDVSPHQVRSITVDSAVKLEVLDWGGSGRPVVFVTGLGTTAHVFDDFAPKLAAEYHVYGITSRGAGHSSAPTTGYDAARLGNDVIAVIDFLKLSKPVVIGWSFSGEVVSAVGVDHPSRVAGLVYLDAAYAYAYYPSERGTFFNEPRYYVDLAELHRKLERLSQFDRNDQVVSELLRVDLPEFERDLRDLQREVEIESHLAGTAQTGPANRAAEPPPPRTNVALMAGMRRFTKISVPSLAIYAVPIATSGLDAAVMAASQAFREEQAREFERGVPNARVVRLPNAPHDIFRSNEADVLREIRAFVSKLP